ncbi:MAG: Methyltransferase protein [Microbacteriaceae bacterium]|jgi:SAM-dependent methyltransferase|nr:Methyltransferase protein [Microbacteriaceae bacterium]
MVELGSGEWLEANRVQWDERVPLHVASEFYDQSKLRAGRGELYPIEERELAGLLAGGLDGKRVLHLQCHFGADTLVLAQRGADVVGIDFSTPAIRAARALASEVGLAERARFVIANIYDARHVLPQPGSFDVVYTTWGTVGWLPDLTEWARIIEWYLKPGGSLYFADGHPSALVFDESGGELPTFAYPYDSEGVPVVVDADRDYAVEDARLEHTRTFEWSHSLGAIVGSLLDAGLRLEFLHEHYEVPWKMFAPLEVGGDRMYRWPREKWLPLALSLAAVKPLG